MFLHRGGDAEEEKKLRSFYGSGYYSLSEFLEETFAKDIKLFESEPNKAYDGLSITMDPEITKDMVASKQRLLTYAGGLIEDDDPVYIEFGVRTGTSMRTVSKALKGERATLYGLDTFTGLPDGWIPMWGNRGDGKINRVRPPGEMSVDQMPDVSDRRVVLIKGLFQDTLPHILPNLGRRRLFVNIDGDTYTAALYGLFMLHPFLKPGDLVYFDEIVDEINEFAAFNDYVRSCYVKDKFVPLARAFDGLLFQIR